MALRKLPFRRLALLAPLGIFLVFIVSACTTSGPQSTFDPVGPVADDQLSLFWLIFWIAVVVFVIVEGMLIYSIIRFRRRKGQEGLPPQIHGNNRLELAWTIVPALILIAIAIPTYITIADQSSPPPGEFIQVEVIGHQWWWEFVYPELGIVTANELRIPVDTVVKLDLLSGDVIHSFWVPKLAGKTDVVPNNRNQMWLLSEEIGTFFGQCAEFCGVSHAHMRFQVIVQSSDDFEAWAKGQADGSPGVDQLEGLALEGSQVFGSRGCVLCHTINGPDAPGVQDARIAAFESGGASFPAPNLTTFGERKTFAGGIIENNTENLRRWLKDPDDVKPGNRMSELAQVYNNGEELSDEEVDALVVYLQSRVPGN